MFVALKGRQECDLQSDLQRECLYASLGSNGYKLIRFIGIGLEFISSLESDFLQALHYQYTIYGH